ncbi:hypothetical protein SVIOM74S_02493 [Streptomyces violarus]
MSRCLFRSGERSMTSWRVTAISRSRACAWRSRSFSCSRSCDRAYTWAAIPVTWLLSGGVNSRMTGERINW